MRKGVLCFCIFLLVGCGEQEKFATYEQTNMEEKQQQIKGKLKEAKEIEAANIVVIYDEIFVALQVNPWQKWNKQKIEKRWQKKLEKEFPNDTVHVSTDFKLHWESTKLLEQDQGKVMDKIEQLKKLAKEET
ncbi:MAG: YhcN/YlaJ family sporulation lipoprotein [Solibacillus sp.]